MHAARINSQHPSMPMSPHPSQSFLPTIPRQCNTREIRSQLWFMPMKADQQSTRPQTQKAPWIPNAETLLAEDCWGLMISYDPYVIVSYWMLLLWKVRDSTKHLSGWPTSLLHKRSRSIWGRTWSQHIPTIPPLTSAVIQGPSFIDLCWVTLKLLICCRIAQNCLGFWMRLCMQNLPMNSHPTCQGYAETKQCRALNTAGQCRWEILADYFLPAASIWISPHYERRTTLCS